MEVGEQQRRRAAGLKKYFSDPSRFTAEDRQRRADRMRALWTPEYRAAYSARFKGKPKKNGHSPETRALISEVVRDRYAKAKAAWIESNGRLELVGNIRWARIDWDIARELRAMGASVDDLAAFFKTLPSVIRRGLKNGR